MKHVTLNVNVPNQTMPLTVNSNGIYNPTQGYIGFSSVDVQVPNFNIQTSKTVNAYSDGNSNYSVVVLPDTGYDAINQSIINVNNYVFSGSIVVSSSSSSGYSDTYIQYSRYAYTIPSNDNSYTSLQNLGSYKIRSNSVYSGIQELIYRGRIQHMTITSNGTYTPYNTSTIIRKVVVNVSPNLTTKTITSNGTYTPTGSYVGFSSVTVNVDIRIPVNGFLWNLTYKNGYPVLLSDMTRVSSSSTSLPVSANKFLLYIAEDSNMYEIHLVCNSTSTTKLYTISTSYINRYYYQTLYLDVPSNPGFIYFLRYYQLYSSMDSVYSNTAFSLRDEIDTDTKASIIKISKTFFKLNF